jgi:uridine kinase
MDVCDPRDPLTSLRDGIGGCRSCSGSTPRAHAKVRVARSMRFYDLARTLGDSHGSRRVTVIGVDGAGSAGKSTFARRLSTALGGIDVITMDDLQGGEQPAGPSGWGWGRLRDEVLVPLSTGEQVRYRVFDWGERKIGSKVNVVEPVGIVIVEGLYSARNELQDFYDFIVWIHCPADVKRTRARARHVNRPAEEIDRWITEEAWYARDHNTIAYADLVVDGTGTNDNEEFDQIEPLRNSISATAQVGESAAKK